MAKFIPKPTRAGQFAANLMWEEYKLDAYHGESPPAENHCAAAFFWWNAHSLAHCFRLPDKLPEPLLKAMLELAKGSEQLGVKRSLAISTPEDVHKN